MCVYCCVVKDGIKSAINKDPVNGQKISKLFYQTFSDWKLHAKQILDILLLHPCSQEIAPAVTSRPLKGMQPADLKQIQILIENNWYETLEDFDQDIRNVWKEF
jgi:hypothetical protein